MLYFSYMEEAIKQFHTQFLWKASIVNAQKLHHFGTYILNGMGGSHLAADLLRTHKPELDLLVFSDYGIPKLSQERLKKSLFIASSFSGNTEEVLHFAEEVLAKKLPLAVIAKGGKLLDFAVKHTLPHIVLPPTKVQPRSGLGFQIVALATLIGDSALVKELTRLSSRLKPHTLEKQGKKLVADLRGKVPVIYSSAKNEAIAYNWKIKFNETGKIPSFYNIFPELNHNEMTGFDVIATTESLSHKFHFIFLTDSTDHPQNRKRMQVTKKLYEDRGLSVTEVPLESTTPVSEDGNTPFTKGDGRLEKMFSSLLVADWTALHLSRIYGTEAEQVPMVEEFKRLVSS